MDEKEQNLVWRFWFNKVSEDIYGSSSDGELNLEINDCPSPTGLGTYLVHISSSPQDIMLVYNRFTKDLHILTQGNSRTIIDPKQKPDGEDPNDIYDRFYLATISLFELSGVIVGEA